MCIYTKRYYIMLKSKSNINIHLFIHPSIYLYRYPVPAPPVPAAMKATGRRDMRFFWATSRTCCCDHQRVEYMLCSIGMYWISYVRIFFF